MWGWMPVVDWTLPVWSVVLSGVGIALSIIGGILIYVLVPSIKLLIATLNDMSSTMQEFRLTIYGSDRDPSTGHVMMIAALRKHAEKEARKLMQTRLELGLKVDERT